MEKMFLYKESNIRTSTDGSGEFWFAGIDVCNILEYKNAPDIITKLLDEDERKLDYLTDRSGQRRKGWTINESGLYALILSSSKSEAKVFRRWVTHEVLPSLRKAGIYSTDGLTRKNALIQELIIKIENKKNAVINSKSTTKKLDKEHALLHVELIQLLKTDPSQMNMYSSEVWDSVKQEITDSNNE